MIRNIWGAVLGAALLASCASRPPGAMADWQHGAKHAWIVQFYASDAPRGALPQCLAALSPAELQTRHFVKVRYWHVRQTYIAVAELPDALKASVNDEVELWPEDCSAGKISRISRVLASAAQ